ncbi:hypothetical protein IF1G_03304 [Cordyceps javanica]|uniref:Uncharacterized protein n=1 Tax=Cordyceps javanica TaxID=43265 RepID=A0A545V773_9HYPO|nr:hypothetical protein IF1G_03304 [Cordyceps javanica]
MAGVKLGVATMMMMMMGLLGRLGKKLRPRLSLEAVDAPGFGTRADNGDYSVTIYVRIESFYRVIELRWGACKSV